jgi:hypothetical protein
LSSLYIRDPSTPQTNGLRLASPSPIQKDGQQLDCELRDHGHWGVEVQIYREREFLYGHRWASRALAMEEAKNQKAAYLAKGGVLIV